MARAPRVAVAISTRNRPRQLARCLTSIANGSLRPAAIVVVDQSVGDETEQVILAQRAAGLPLDYVRHRDSGLGASQNVALRRALEPYVAVIDDDCVAEQTWLATIARTLQADAVDLVGGRVLPMESEGEHVFPVSSRTATIRRRFAGRALPWLIGSGNNFAVRRELFLQIGGCDERLGPGSPAHGGVDMDLFYRLTRAGARALYEPDAVVYHERQTAGDRKARRPMYGRGTGAAIALWLKQGDVYALRVLLGWLSMRSGTLARALLRADGRVAREELVMLASTARGLLHGFSVGASARKSSPAT